MTELLKVLKFVLRRERKRALKALCRVKRYKGLYAFLGGVMVFSVCFAGKGGNGIFAYNGAYAALLPPSAEDVTENIAALASVPLSNAGALLSVTENPVIKAQRVPYVVFPDSAAVLRNSAENAVLSDESDSEPENSDSGISLLSGLPEDASDSLGALDESESDVSESAPKEISETASDSSPNNAENDSEEQEDGEEEEISEEEKTEKETGEEKKTTEETNEEEETKEETNEEKETAEEENAAPEWSETAASGIKYVNTDLIYSRAKAVEGSEKINRYRINDAVEIEALTDTHYYRLKTGEFIHEDYLSGEESAKWTEAPAEGVMYIKSGGIYSRNEALEGSEKVSRYNLNDTVTVIALTNTDYYKIAEGEFIHSDFLSPTEIVEYPLSTLYGQRAQTLSEQELSQQVFDVVNGIRAEHGLPAFKQLDSLNAAAAERAWETTVYNSHTRPDGTRCFTVLDEYGMKNPSTKAENIAKWYSSAQAVVNAWMSDYAHRSAILGNHEYMGVGCYYVSGDYYGYYWAQMFYTP